MDTNLTRDIETRAESYALSTAAELIADEYHNDTKGGEWTPEIRWAIRKAWIAGRDWQHQQGDHLRAALQKQQDVEDHSLECLYCLHDDPCTERDRLVADAGVARADALA